VAISCGAPGNLRINEIGSCYWANSSCWLEVHNTSATLAEDLSTYQLRTQSTLRVSPWTMSPTHTFALPSLTVPAGGYAIVRGRSSDSLVDGGNVAHIVDGDNIPWWNSAGFIELLNGGRTVDFVRFGSSGMAPTTSTSWIGAAAAALPSASDAYGYVLARDLVGSDSDRAGDWYGHAFGTPGGPNDITADADVDGDGIPDQAEHAGATYAGLDLYAMGARPGQRDLFLQIDRMASKDAGLTPQRAALDKVVAAFAARGIALHPDVGSLYSPSFNPAAYNLGGGTAVPYAAGITLGATNDGRANLYAYKTAYMDVRLHAVFYYMLFANSQNADGSGGSSGLAEVGGNDSIITLGSWGLNTRSTYDINVLTNYQAGTIMHEFGHNLGLQHGGFEGTNYKPNYVSVMNYMYQLSGLPTIGNGEGDRYALYQGGQGHACGVTSWAQLKNGPNVDPSLFRIDYSDGSSATLDESSLNDAIGFGRAGSTAVDFNCDGVINAGYSYDANADSGIGVLADYDDWDNLMFVFQRHMTGNDNGVSPHLLRPAFVTAVADPVAHDLQPVADEPAPPAAFFAQLANH